MAAPAGMGGYGEIGEDLGRLMHDLQAHPAFRAAARLALPDDLAREVLDDIIDKHLVFQVRDGNAEQGDLESVAANGLIYRVIDPNVEGAIRRGAFQEARAEAEAQGLNVFARGGYGQREQAGNQQRDLLQRVGGAAERVLNAFVPGVADLVARRRH